MQTLNFTVKIFLMLYSNHNHAAADDPRYADIRDAIICKRIWNFDQILHRMSKTTICTAIGVKVNRFDRMLPRPGSFKGVHIENLATLFGISVLRMVYLLYNRTVVRTQHKVSSDDPRYTDIGRAILSRRICRIEQVFKRVKKTLVAKMIGMKIESFNAMLKCPGSAKLERMEILASLFRVSILRVISLLYNRPIEKIASRRSIKHLVM